MLGKYNSGLGLDLVSLVLGGNTPKGDETIDQYIARMKEGGISETKARANWIAYQETREADELPTGAAPSGSEPSVPAYHTYIAVGIGAVALIVLLSVIRKKG